MAETVIETLSNVVERHGDLCAYKERKNGDWIATTWKEYSERAHQVARGFMALGLEPGKGVAILGSNRPEWLLSDIGAILAGGVPAGIYVTSSAEQCKYIAAHCEAQVIVVENTSQLAKIDKVRAELPDLRAVVLMEGKDPAGRALSWEELDAARERTSAEQLEERKKAQKPADVCTLIYTSGTTGPPKAVMITHRNLTWTAETAIEEIGRIAGQDVLVSYLPLSHIAEQLLSIHLPMVMGGSIYFERDLERLGETLREAQPTVFVGVPRVWEKIQAKMMAVGASGSPLKKRIAAWARGVGLAAGLAEQQGRRKPLLYPLADKLVFDKVRQSLGLARCRLPVSSTAPIAKSTLEFFLSLGVPICEVYGMSECTGPATLSKPSRMKTGKAGYPLSGSEIKIADDGEICMRGPHVFAGYFKDPKATAEALDPDGWLHSGDIGKLEDGFLQVTDRKKELIITAGGKNIAPAVVEGALKTVPVIAQAVVIGDRRAFLSALVTLDSERILAEARLAGIEGVTDRESAASSPEFNAHVQKLVTKACSVLSRVETVRKIKILPGELTEQGGELTPTMKLKRRVIADKYAAEIESIYTE